MNAMHIMSPVFAPPDFLSGAVQGEAGAEANPEDEVEPPQVSAAGRFCGAAEVR